jgi:phosphate transport system substrate-binding protein
VTDLSPKNARKGECSEQFPSVCPKVLCVIFAAGLNQKTMKLKSVIAALSTSALLCGSVFAQSKIVIKGSDTLGAKMVPQLTAVYKAIGNSVDFEIAAEGSSTAFTALLEGTADVGMSSRDVKAGERDSFTAKGKEIVEHVAGIDMIAIVVNEGNSVDNLTLKQIEGIFTGEITDWSEVGGKAGKISAYTRNTSSGTYKTFQELAMNKRDYGSSTQKMAGNEAIASEVGKNPNGIGYVGLAYTENDGLKAVNVDKHSLEEPDAYPLARQLYYYTVGEPEGEVANFLEWATTSEPAQKVITKVGFIPAKKK